MDELLELVNVHLVDPYILHATNVSSVYHPHAPWSMDYSTERQFFVLWGFTYVTSMMMYLAFATLTFFLFFLDSRGKRGSNSAYWKWDTVQILNEMWVSTWSLFLMAGLTTLCEIYMMAGGGKIYHNVSDYGLAYLIISPILFLIFTDTLIYWIHRILHYGVMYKLHKLHHKYKETTPFSAFSFHPLDGFAQSFPYHVFVYFFPMHNRLYAATLFIVGLWTINIHDRVTLDLPGVNGAAHHTIHHTKFNYNYGQYFTFWDRVFGTYMDPHKYFPYKEDGKKDENEMNENNSEIQSQQTVESVQKRKSKKVQ
jgi:lathosterol oxidase